MCLVDNFNEYKWCSLILTTCTYVSGFDHIDICNIRAAVTYSPVAGCVSLQAAGVLDMVLD